MTYQQTIDYLYAQLPMFSRIGAAAYKKDLHNTIALCKALDDPHTKFKSIHIAGTNGKGSTSHMLAAVLQQAGYKTALYTSPHLKDFRERIKINGEMISESFVVDFVERTKPLCDEIQPSFFELTVAMAFDYFEKEKVDIAVIETGLGGRLDSTNIITPLLSIITNIGFDHMNILGNTLQEIAAEKAGIIKHSIPVVIGEYLPETKNIFINKAEQENAPIHFAQEEFLIADTKYCPISLHCTVIDTRLKLPLSFALDLNGIYQANNLCTVLCALDILRGANLLPDEYDEQNALAKVKKLTGLYGRWDVITEKPTIVLDVAHNEDGIKQLLQQLKIINQPAAATHLILGMVKDKDISKVLSLLPGSASYYFSNAHIPRALHHAELKEKAAGFGLHGESYDDVNEALKAVRQNATEEDMIIVCGSVFLVAEVDTGLLQ
jgi:dihydrofolate synthase / folylpolyglutamate synthase